MSLQCPLCNSHKIASFRTAMKTGAAIGTIGGAARGASAALAGSQFGAAVGAITGSIGISLGTISGAVLGGLVGGVGGCTLGAQLGEKLDRHVLANISASSAVIASTCLPDSQPTNLFRRVLHNAQHLRRIVLKRIFRMKYHKLKAGETTGTYVMESPVTEADILQMAQQLAMSRLFKGRALTDPKQVFIHLQTLLQYHEHEVFALLLLDTKHRVISFRELFRGTLDDASVYPREVLKIALEHNAAAVILVHNHPSGDPEPSQADRQLTTTLKNALNLIGTQILDHVVVGYEGCVSLAERGYL